MNNPDKIPWYRLASVWSGVTLLLLAIGMSIFYFTDQTALPSRPLYFWTMAVVAVIIFALGLFYLIRTAQGKISAREPDYYNFFIVGICWFPLGIAMNNKAIWALGMLLVMIGLLNKKRWTQTSNGRNLPPIRRSWRRIIILIVLGMIIAGSIAYYLTTRQSASAPEITTLNDASTIPEVLVYKDLVRLSTPQPETVITSPLIIKGEARGTWFFEASFPVVLTDWDGLIIAQGVATAQSEWMTEDYVPFIAELTFVKPDYGERGALILRKDNPSGLPEHDDALEITVFFE